MGKIDRKQKFDRLFDGNADMWVECAMIFILSFFLRTETVYVKCCFSPRTTFINFLCQLENLNKCRNFTEGKLYAFSPNNFINNNNISQNTKYCWKFLILYRGIRVCPFSFDDQSHAVRWRRLIRRGRTGTGVETVFDGSWSWEAAEVLLLLLELWWVCKRLLVKVITARTVAENESVVAEFYLEVFFPEKRHPEYDQDQD